MILRKSRPARECHDARQPAKASADSIKWQLFAFDIAVSLAPTDMSAVVPVQYLADMVVLISDATTGKPVLAVIIEPQLRDSETKRYRYWTPWPAPRSARLTGCA